MNDTLNDSLLGGMDWDDENWNAGGATEEAAEPWPTPTEGQMQDRNLYRKAMEDQTVKHRRVHPAAASDKSRRNIAATLIDRQVYGNNTRGRALLRRSHHAASNKTLPLVDELRFFAEFHSVIGYNSAFLSHLGGADEMDSSGTRPSSSSAVSTISIAFSSTANTMASTHGDHSVKITCTITGRLLKVLEGHPRTPWTVKYHPFEENIVASGCLGFQVRIWDWRLGQCLHMIRLEYAIISLSFHPTGHILAIASGSRLHFWDYANFGGRESVNNSNNNNADGSSGTGTGTTGVITEIEQRNMLRCVHFPPNGHSIIVGGINQEDHRRRAGGRGGMSGGGISFYLKLWDFDMESALHPIAPQNNAMPRGTARLPRKTLMNPRTVVPRALLYNDGGFDVSPDGKTLCACAEYWLPEGVGNAMDLMRDDDDDDETDHKMNDSVNAAGIQNGRPVVTTTSCLSPPRQRGARVVMSPPPPPQASGVSGMVPITPPNNSRTPLNLSPPSPPGRRLGVSRNAAAHTNGNTTARDRQNQHTYAIDNEPPPGSDSTLPTRPPHPLSVITAKATYADMIGIPGRYVPHVVTVSLETAPLPPQCGIPRQLRDQLTSVALKGHQPRLGQLLEACPLDGAKASAVTCVKFSPSADFCLLGYGVREPLSADGQDSQYHPVTALYRVRNGMTHISTMLSGDDDVNIARFHPDSGYGFVYGTKQGRVRVLSPRPWNYYS